MFATLAVRIHTLPLCETDAGIARAPVSVDHSPLKFAAPVAASAEFAALIAFAAALTASASAATSSALASVTNALKAATKAKARVLKVDVSSVGNGAVGSVVIVM
ncbi:MAG: hypothetical protein ACOVKL_04940 [Polynucleobacter sp.]